MGGLNQEIARKQLDVLDRGEASPSSVPAWAILPSSSRRRTNGASRCSVSSARPGRRRRRPRPGSTPSSRRASTRPDTPARSGPFSIVPECVAVAGDVPGHRRWRHHHRPAPGGVPLPGRGSACGPVRSGSPVARIRQRHDHQGEAHRGDFRRHNLFRLHFRLSRCAS